ncbi:MAG: type II toxin-antitoxin system Phd/YefM family antitoxin [Acidimicrobiia bacterium]|nr:type II toxin-antitoxin system Phd/YefM family antitoxin [Acidimicrobiia bacterium]
MPVRTMSSREFNQSTGTAKVAALTGPVFVTDRGRPSHVLLSYDHYRRLTNGTRTLADVMGSTSAASDVELELPVRRSVARPAVLE